MWLYKYVIWLILTCQCLTFIFVPLAGHWVFKNLTKPPIATCELEIAFENWFRFIKQRLSIIKKKLTSPTSLVQYDTMTKYDTAWHRIKTIIIYFFKYTVMSHYSVLRTNIEKLKTHNIKILIYFYIFYKVTSKEYN